MDLIPGSDLPWEYVTAPGLIWFERVRADGNEDYDYNAPGYLVAPYFWLWMLSRLAFQESPSNKYFYKFLSEWEFNDYKELLRLKTGSGPSGNITWQNFETFCCYFRILRSLGFGDELEVRLEQLHSGCKLRDRQETMVVNQHLHYAEAVHQYITASTAVEDVNTKHTGTLNADDQLSHIILNAPSAPAGDFFFSIKTGPGSQKQKHNQNKIVREIGQCKLIRSNLTQGTYNKERKKAAGPDDIFILYTTTEVSDDFQLPERSGLVDKSCWDSYFGLFAGRAYIASQYVGSQD
jgi:hypothetical protein